MKIRWKTVTFRTSNTDVRGRRTADWEVGICSRLHSGLWGETHPWGQAGCVLGQARTFISMPRTFTFWSLFMYNLMFIASFYHSIETHDFVSLVDTWIFQENVGATQISCEAQCVSITLHICPLLQTMFCNNSLNNLTRSIPSSSPGVMEKLLRCSNRDNFVSFTLSIAGRCTYLLVSALNARSWYT